MVQVRRIHHINFAVKDLKAAEDFFIDTFGGKVLRRPDHSGDGLLSTVMEIGGVTIELLQPIDETSAEAKLIATRGEGLQSISFEVDSAEEAVKELEAKGMRIVGKVLPRRAFIHPKHSFGVMFQIHSKE